MRVSSSNNLIIPNRIILRSPSTSVQTPSSDVAPAQSSIQALNDFSANFANNTTDQNKPTENNNGLMVFIGLLGTALVAAGGIGLHRHFNPKSIEKANSPVERPISEQKTANPSVKPSEEEKPEEKPPETKFVDPQTAIDPNPQLGEREAPVFPPAFKPGSFGDLFNDLETNSSDDAYNNLFRKIQTKEFIVNPPEEPPLSYFGQVVQAVIKNSPADVVLVKEVADLKEIKSRVERVLVSNGSDLTVLSQALNGLVKQWIAEKTPKPIVKPIAKPVSSQITLPLKMGEWIPQETKGNKILILSKPSSITLEKDPKNLNYPNKPVIISAFANVDVFHGADKPVVALINDEYKNQISEEGGSRQSFITGSHWAEKTEAERELRRQLTYGDLIVWKEEIKGTHTLLIFEQPFLDNHPRTNNNGIFIVTPNAQVNDVIGAVNQAIGFKTNGVLHDKSVRLKSFPPESHAFQTQAYADALSASLQSIGWTPPPSVKLLDGDPKHLPAFFQGVGAAASEGIYKKLWSDLQAGKNLREPDSDGRATAPLLEQVIQRVYDQSPNSLTKWEELKILGEEVGNLQITYQNNRTELLRELELLAQKWGEKGKPAAAIVSSSQKRVSVQPLITQLTENPSIQGSQLPQVAFSSDHPVAIRLGGSIDELGAEIEQKIMNTIGIHNGSNLFTNEGLNCVNVLTGRLHRWSSYINDFGKHRAEILKDELFESPNYRTYGSSTPGTYKPLIGSLYHVNMIDYIFKDLQYFGHALHELELGVLSPSSTFHCINSMEPIRALDTGSYDCPDSMFVGRFSLKTSNKNILPYFNKLILNIGLLNGLREQYHCPKDLNKYSSESKEYQIKHKIGRNKEELNEAVVDLNTKLLPHNLMVIEAQMIKHTDKAMRAIEENTILDFESNIPLQKLESLFVNLLQDEIPKAKDAQKLDYVEVPILAGRTAYRLTAIYNHLLAKIAYKVAQGGSRMDPNAKAALILRGNIFRDKILSLQKATEVLFKHAKSRFVDPKVNFQDRLFLDQTELFKSKHGKRAKEDKIESYRKFFSDLLGDDAKLSSRLALVNPLITEWNTISN